MLRSCHGISKLAAVLLLATVVVVSGGAVVVYEHLSSSPESKIDLRFTGTDPPNPEPPCVLYRDIVDLPDPTWLGLTIRYFDDDVVALYFQITGDNANYSFQTVQLGRLDAGTNDYQNLDAFASRPKPLPADLPGGEWVEPVDLVLKAYTDAAYTNLKWTFTKTLFIHWINSADATFSVDVLNDFDDGTVQGWAAASEYGDIVASVGVASDYVLSTPYSLRLNNYSPSGGTMNQARIYKSFTTPNKSKIFAIIDIRTCTNFYNNGILISRDSSILVQIGKRVFETANSAPRGKWMRIVVPLPANTTLELRISYKSSFQAQPYNQNFMWLDDFKILSK